MGLGTKEFTGSQDWEYQGRVKLAGGYGRHIDHVVGFWRQHAGSRVGTAQFRPDYVRSIEKACLSLRSHAQAMGKLDQSLQKRLGWILYLHALEFSINNHLDDHKRLMNEAVRTTAEQVLINIF